MNMSIIPITRILAIAAVLMAGTCRIASAEMVAGVSLGAQTIVDGFNAMNGGQGYIYTNIPGPTAAGAEFLTNYSFQNSQNIGGTTDTPNLSAYELTNRFGPTNDIFLNSFLTLNVGTKNGYPNYSSNSAQAYMQGFGTLSYNSTAGTTNMANGKALTVGAAYLYKLLATTDVTYDENDGFGNGYNISLNGELFELQLAIRFLSGDFGEWNSIQDWNDNYSEYMDVLLDMNSDISYWGSAYNPDAYYDEIGNYSIFVLNAYWQNPSNFYDYLYIAESSAETPPVTPEPATMLMFALGIASLPLARCRRRRKS